MIKALENTHAGFKDYALRKAVVALEYPEVLKDRNIFNELHNVLKEGLVRTLLQPIISLKDGQVFGYEALSRGPAGTMLENPGVLFEAATVCGKLWELEFLCRLKALEKASMQKDVFNIFINVDPNIINDEKFTKGFTKEFLKIYNINPENVVFEITERNSVNDLKGFKKLISNYKDQGYKIAIDDTGSGYSGLKLITDLNPHFIKLDMNLVKDIDKDGVKHALIKTLNEFCAVTDIKVIAEGIETKEELNALINIGVDYGQGYYIQKPEEEIKPIGKSILEFIVEANYKKSKQYNSKPSSVFIGDICRTARCISPNYNGEQVLEVFRSNQYILGIPVVDGDKLCGLVMKDKFFAKLGTQYGYSLFSHRPITLLMDNRPLCVEYSTTIDIVSKLAMNRSNKNLYDYVIVMNAGKYQGIVTVKDLLEKTTELEVNYAKHLNPLSGLPGNVLIEQKLEEYVACSQAYTVLYIDIDNFKIYNDVYGFERGDRILQFLSRILLESVSSEFGSGCFVGHIGGDDFVIIVESHEVERLCNQIIDAFSKGICNYYSEEHIKKGCISKKGSRKRYNMATLSIAGVTSSTSYKDVFELIGNASRIKQKCKDISGNCCIIE